MGFFWRKHDSELEQIQEYLKIECVKKYDVFASDAADVAKIEAKIRMKNHIFSRIRSYSASAEPSELAEFLPSGISRFLAFLRISAGAIFPDAALRSHMKERIFARIAEKISAIRPFSFFNIFPLRRTLSFAMILIFATATLVFFQPQPTFAQRLTTLEVLKGNISILRGAKNFSASSDMVLYEGDILSTGQESEAVIHYFDDSFSRLFADTKVQLKRLEDEKMNSSMIVQVDLDSGKMWSRVFDLVSDSQFTVQAKDLIASVYHRATFIVSAQEKKSSVQVISNTVNVKTSRNFSKSKPVTKGFQAVVATTGISNRFPAVAPFRLKEEEKKWVETNLQRDEQLIAEAEQEKIEQKGGQDSLKNPHDSSFFLSFDPFEKAKVSLLLVQKKFEQAQNTEQKNAAFDDFIANLQSLHDESSVLLKKDPSKAAEFSRLVRDAFNVSKKAASPEIKEKLYSAEISMASDDFSRSAILIEQAASLLSEAQDFIDQGSSELAAPRFAQFEEKIAAADKVLKSVSSPSADPDQSHDSSNGAVAVLPQSVPLFEKIENSRKLYAVLQTRIPSTISVDTDESVSDSSSLSDEQTHTSTTSPESQPESQSVNSVPENIESAQGTLPSDTSAMPVTPFNTSEPSPTDTPKVLPPDVLLPKLQLPRR